ncbi:hypothetical protein GCM10011342_29150 [Aquisalinus flavus]|uniref:Cobalamin biosynthesis protein CbiG n=1 Tax=Aquisalinus flavus TaxID=1526572 RepID=A0A8J2Y602_9PROT|nr:cobalamin biosynthesis protein CbiG [Aquisalinus flavus]MBD0428105.1 cobalamin biosynthesis protein CbiG [Aquisalinus flavus]GGD18634.1 hypothetical protein GCM10011342_29150 [Aquisalinus flavus]
MPLFDEYLVCDWSAANGPKLGKDSVWIATATRRNGRISTTMPENVRTRHDAMAVIRAACLAAVTDGRRLFAGFDFAFGYPAGTARAVTGRADWRALWRVLGELIEDDAQNASNRFDVAAFLNRSCFGADRAHGGPFWGHPAGRTYDGLGPKRPSRMPDGIAEKRRAETVMQGAQPVWKLAYTGAVGSQSLLGIARLEALRRDPALKRHIVVWPFETGFAETLTSQVTLAEIYPSAFPVTLHDGEVKDAAQVRTLASVFARLDKADRFGPLLERPAGLDGKAVRDVLDEEGWIVGAGLIGREGKD